MIVEQYGIKYSRVTEQDIELIRYWRNQPFIRDTMQFKEYITAEMQVEWFKKINNKYNYYFIIEADDKKIGVINCKDTDPISSKDIVPTNRVAEGGIFIWDKNYWGTPVPVLASLTVLECIYEVLSASARSVIVVAKNNTRALIFNKLLGYEIFEEYKNDLFYKLILTKEHYFERTCKLKKAAKLYSNGQSQLKITAAVSNLLSDEWNNYLRKTNL